MLDEGIVQEGAYSESQNEKYRGEKFKNVIYDVTSGEFQNQIKGFADGYADCLDLKHYIIITPSFNIDVVSEWKPSIEVSKRKNRFSSKLSLMASIIKMIDATLSV